jgi:hypothetical protein
VRRIALLALCLTLSLTGLALAAGKTVYKGTTNQTCPGTPAAAPCKIAITVKKKKVTKVHGVARCGFSVNISNVGSYKIKKGHFSGKVDYGTIAGKLSGKTITGTISGTVGSCNGLKITYTASK